MAATLLSEITLVTGIVILLLVSMFRKENTPKTFFTISKMVLVISLMFMLIFYNRSSIPEFIEHTAYTTLFKAIAYIITLVWFYVSLKWFLSKDTNSAAFYLLGLLSLLGLGLMISAINLGIVFAGTAINIFTAYFMIRLNPSNEQVPVIAKKYLIFGMIFLVLLAVGIGIIYAEAGSLRYAIIKEHITIDTLNIKMSAAIIFVLAVLCFIMGAAPFHFWYADSVGVSILPVSGYLSLVPFIAYLACFGDLMVNVFIGVYPVIKDIMIVFGAASVIMGAIGVSGETNLRKIFAYGTLFHIGVIIIALSPLDVKGLISAYVYLVTYVLAMLGVYTAFYGFKSKGIYLTDLSSIAGIYKTKPYIAAAFLVCIISLIGSPPMLGFLGRLSVIDALFYSKLYWLIFIILLSLLFLASGYFKVIRMVYFDDAVNKFDRADKGIYICLMVNIVLVVITLIRPRTLMMDFEEVLVTLFG